jgi:hypothetical protein
MALMMLPIMRSDLLAQQTIAMSESQTIFMEGYSRLYLRRRLTLEYEVKNRERSLQGSGNIPYIVLCRFQKFTALIYDVKFVYTQ